MIRTLADKVEDTFWQRFKGYSWIGGTLITVILGALGFFGFTTINGASQKIEPIVQAGVRRAETARQNIEQSAAKIDAVKTGIDKLSAALDVQTRRLNDKNADISRKLAEFDAAQKKMEAAEKRSETLAQQLDGMGRSLQTKVQQISNQVNDITVRRVYPSLGQAMYVVMNGGPWKSKTEKKPGEIWISVTISPTATGNFSEIQVKQLLETLKQAGYTPLLGMFGVSGPYSTGFSNLGGAGDNSVIYFSKDWQQKAAALNSIASKALSRQMAVEFVDSTTLPKDNPLRFVIEQSGLDAQIYLAH